MIYSCYFAGLLSTGKFPIPGVGTFIQPTTKIPESQYILAGKSRGAAFAKWIKESKGDTFLFITTNAQSENWDDFVKNHGLKEFIDYEMPRPITNGNHNHGRNLTLHVLKSKEST